jgi:hypothetical protein
VAYVGASIIKPVGWGSIKALSLVRERQSGWEDGRHEKSGPTEGRPL